MSESPEACGAPPGRPPGRVRRSAPFEHGRFLQKRTGLIARAAVGSVRVGLTLLDPARVQGEAGQRVKDVTVRDMKGLSRKGANPKL